MTMIENIVSEAEWIVYYHKTGVSQRFVNEVSRFKNNFYDKLRLS